MGYAIVYDSRTGNTEALARAVAEALPDKERLAFMCQGRMPRSVRDRYARTTEANPAQAARMAQLIENFDEALAHPDDGDLARLREKVQSL